MPCIAQLADLTNPALQDKSERYISLRDGGGRMVWREDVSLRQMAFTTAAKDSAGVTVRAHSDGAVLEATSRALGFPEDWKPFGALEATLQAGTTRLLVEVSVLGARNRMVQSRWVDAGEAATFRFDLGDLPLAAGTRPPFHPTGLKVQIRWGDTWPSEGIWVAQDGSWPATADNEPVSWHLQSVKLLERNDSDYAVVDAFGQRRRGSWATKVLGQEHFDAVKAEEEVWLAATPGPEGRDRFGGWVTGPQLEATGFFRVIEHEGRWWYVDPDGHLFWSVGTTGIRISDTTQLEDREELFGQLPDRSGAQAAFYTPPIASPANDGHGKEVVSYYLLNVLRKYGTFEAWRDRVIERFQTVGYNTFGNWSDRLIMEQRQVPHTRALNTLVGTATICNGHMPDVFDPDWEGRLAERFAAEATPQRDNPWLIGYFVDNELGWGNVGRHAFNTPTASPIRQELAAFLAAHYEGDLSAARRDFASDADGFSALAESADADVAKGDDQPAVLSLFADHYAERYFETVARVLKAADPNHLYLGCRFVRRRPADGICAAAGRHCDVVTVNCYSLLPERKQFEDWHRSTGKPIQIGEHHLPLRSERQLQPLYPAFTADERREFYEQFLNSWAEQPWSLGAHWFQHADQNATGRPLDGENQTVGFVDIVDRPHPELVEAAMAATRTMYDRHAAAD